MTLWFWSIDHHPDLLSATMLSCQKVQNIYHWFAAWKWYVAVFINKITIKFISKIFLIQEYVVFFLVTAINSLKINIYVKKYKSYEYSIKNELWLIHTFKDQILLLYVWSIIFFGIKSGVHIILLFITC